MPQDGSGNYTIPLGTYGIPDETIESAAYNNFLNDLRDNDLNKARPIHRGGTAAQSADEALLNLGAEKAAQPVTNYDTHVWFPGSFRAAGSATHGPVDGHAFSGICYINEPLANPPTNANVVVSARDLDDTVVPSRVYVREKKANLWGVWTVIDATTLPFPPSGGITGDTIIEAIQELDTEKASIVYVDAQDAILQTNINALDTEKADITYVNSVSALNFDGLAYFGMQTNGSFTVNQDINPYGQNTIPGAVRITDGWRAFHAPLSNSQISIGARGMNLYTHRPYNTPAALTASDTFYLYTAIEGYRCSRLTWGLAFPLNKMPMTISFFSMHHKVGTYCVAIQNSAHDRAYVATYTQTVADVEQFQTITIPPETSGTWLNDTGIGMYIYFVIAAGANYETTANFWTGSNKLSVAGSVNSYQDITDRFRISGVMINMGNVAPPAERVPYLVRPYEQEFALCQRYYQNLWSTGATPVASGMIQAATTALFAYRFPTKMRIAPVFSTIAPSNFAIYAGGTGYAVSAIAAAGLHAEGTRLDVTSAGMTVGQGAVLTITSVNTPTMIFDAGFV